VTSEMKLLTWHSCDRWTVLPICQLVWRVRSCAKPTVRSGRCVARKQQYLTPKARTNMPPFEMCKSLFSFQMKKFKCTTDKCSPSITFHLPLHTFVRIWSNNSSQPNFIRKANNAVDTRDASMKNYLHSIQVTLACSVQHGTY
jgi:hypothetical protein